jgi:hypothetical protein
MSGRDLTVVLQYLLLVVPGENDDGVVKDRSCKLAERLVYEAERGKTFGLHDVSYDPR